MLERAASVSELPAHLLSGASSEAEAYGRVCPELLEALRDRAELNGEKLQVSFDDLLASVAFQSNTTVRELWGWTIKAFEQRRRAIDRHINHLICGIGEMSGNVSWKNGNPYPSWCFDKKVNTRTQFVSEGEMLGQFGKVGSIQ